MENIRQEGHGKIDTYMNQSYSEKDKYYNEITLSAIKCCTSEELEINNKENKASLLDIFSTKGLSKNYFPFLMSNLVNKLEKSSGKTLFDHQNAELTKEGIDYVNILLNESLEYYSNYLLRNIGSSFIKKWNKDKNSNKIELTNNKEVRDFFNHSSSQKNASATRQIHCSLLKIAYAINDIKTNEDKIDNAEKEFGTIKQKLFFTNFLDFKGNNASESIENEKNDFRYIKLQTKCEKSGKGNIIFNCAGRVKRKEQILVKEISDPKYDSVEVIKDIYGIRNEVKTKEDALFLLEYMRIHVLNRSGEISYKNIFGNNLKESQNFVREHSNKLDPEFYAYLYKSLKEDTTKGKNNKNYKDVKIRGNLGGHSSEIQINLVDNKNETGYAHHLIFDCKKKIRALSRLQGYVPYSIIHRYIREAINKSILEAEKYGGYAELVGLGGYHGSIKKINEEHKKNAENKIFNYLLNIEQDIVKLNIPGANNNLNYYTSLSNWNHFHEEGKYVTLYPKGAKARDITTKQRTDEAITA